MSITKTNTREGAPDCGDRNEAHEWTWREYGYEKIAVLDARGTEIAATHRRDYARLIAAAPDMMAALKDFVAAAKRTGVQHDALRGRVERAEAALAKAEAPRV